MSAFLFLGCLWIVAGASSPSELQSAAGSLSPGHEANAAVGAESRIDWVFALANQSPKSPPAELAEADYRATEQRYERYVPANVTRDRPQPVLLFISPGGRGMAAAAWKPVCDEHGMIYASPHGAGNDCPTARRVRIVLDVLDDLRRLTAVDPERTYLGGFSGGGRIACAVAFSLPEYFGGVVPVCAAGDLRTEPWLRHRVIDRLSVAHVTGETDFNRGEVERFRGPVLADVGVRSRVWVVPGLGHATPKTDVCREVFEWLEAGVERRRAWSEKYPAGRAASEPTSRDDQAAALLEEGLARRKQAATAYAGLMLLKGVLERWPDTASAATARRVLEEQERSNDRAWEAEDVAEQRRHLVARSRGLSAYALGPLPPVYINQRPAMLRAAQRLWEQVLADGQDEKAVVEARETLTKLQMPPKP